MPTDGVLGTGSTRRRPDRLELRVVEYPNAPDRCTVYPPDLDDRERMTHWMSADRDAFVSLELRR